MKKLLYHYEMVYESWVFITEEQVEEQERKYGAFLAETWGEFRATLPKEDYEWIGPILAENHFEREDYTEEELATLTEPPDDAPFKQHEWHVWSEYPDFLIFFQHENIPDDILEKYAEKELTMHDGEFYQVEEHVIDDVLRALKEHGIECERRDDLEIAAW